MTRKEAELRQREARWEKEKGLRLREAKLRYERRHLRRGFREGLGRSPINYWSDLFIVFMVAGWAVAIPVMAAAATYAMVANGDSGIWQYFTELVTVPLASGSCIWLVKCSVQHAIANHRGEECPSDFPRVEGAELNGDAEKPGS